MLVKTNEGGERHFPLAVTGCLTAGTASSGTRPRDRGAPPAQGAGCRAGTGEAERLPAPLLSEAGCEEAVAKSSRRVAESGSTWRREGAGHGARTQEKQLASGPRHCHHGHPTQPGPPRRLCPPSRCPQPCATGHSELGLGAAGSEAPRSHPLGG